MAVIKCKMCGGGLEINSEMTVGKCPYCDSIMTFPKLSDTKKENLYNRAEELRKAHEFDKAIAAYENVLSEDNSDPESHWGIVLCRYGIEYVEDPVSHERVPTCHRVHYDSILTDPDYLAACELAQDFYTREVYEKEAKRIGAIQKEILAVSNKEEAFDVFICYKEATDGGSRTKDSALAHDIYYQLTHEGYKVFFARITLENKLGQAYEPYIFSALNTAKVMLVIGTKPEHFNAVWVKNEWSRFLALMKKDKNKLLIPCYRDMAPYDLPEELSMLQSQDMGKIGFIQDLLHGIKKMSDVSQNNANTFSEIPVELGVENYELHDELEAKSKEIEGLENEKVSQYGLQDYVTNFFSNIKKGKTALSAKDHKVTAHFFQQAQKDYDFLINKYRKSEEEERIKKEEKSKIEIVCPHCHQEYKASESDLQQEVECAMCCRKFTITQTKYCSSCGTPNPMQAFSCWSCLASFYMTKPIPEKEKIPEPIQRFSSADSLGMGYKIAFFIYSLLILGGLQKNQAINNEILFPIIGMLYFICSFKVLLMSRMITKSYRKIFWTTFRKISIGVVLIAQVLLLLLTPFYFFELKEDMKFSASEALILIIFLFTNFLFNIFMTIKLIQLFNIRAKEDVDFVEDKAFIAEQNSKITIKLCLIIGICSISCTVLYIIWKMLSS